MKTFKKIILLGLFVFSPSLFSQTQYATEYEVQYEISYSLDSLNLDRKKNETGFLYTGPEYGVFLNYNEAHAVFIKDEIAKQIKTGRVEVGELLVPTDFPKQFFKDKKENTVTVISKIGRDQISYLEDATAFAWEITEETKEFLGYQTQKATTSFGGRDYEAWFTLEIPISDGPYIFYGLPGLIIALYDTEKHYSFEVSAIQKLEEPKIWELPKALSMSKQKYLEDLERLSKNKAKGGSALLPPPPPPQAGTFVNNNGRELSQADYIRMQKENLKSRNNPIELK